MDKKRDSEAEDVGMYETNREGRTHKSAETSSQEIQNLDHVGKYITLLNRAQNVLITKKLAKLNITRGQLPVMLGLYKQEEVSQQELADLYDLDKSVITKTIDNLEDLGFVGRRQDPSDRRRNLIYLTSKGKQFKPTLIAILEKKEEEMNKGISSSDRELIKRLVKKMIQNIKKQLE